MDGNQKYWLGLWAMVLAAAVVFAITIHSYNVMELQAKADALATGVAPEVITCVFEDSISRDTCVVLAASKN